MVSKKRLDTGLDGYRAPFIPKAPRSIRRRGPLKKLVVEHGELCAFELLAAVAGKLLQESESSASSNIAEGKSPLDIFPDENERVQPKEDNKALKSESFDHGSFAESAFVPEVSVQEHNLLSNFKGLPQEVNDYVVEHTNVHASSDFLEKIDCDIKLGICEDKISENGSEMQLKDEKNEISYLSMANISTVNDPVGECVNTNNVLINSEGSVKLPLYRDPISGALLRKHRNNVKLGIRDDDENSFGCNKSSTKVRAFRPQLRTGHNRIRKMMTSKYWKSAPKLRDCDLYNTSEGMKSYYRYRKNIYARERCQRAPLKKRKLYDHDRSSDSISNLPEKVARADKSGAASFLHKANGASVTGKGHSKAKDSSHVKFSIKSFKVPELYIEVPETATVGSLKKTVMETVTAILGGGIRVGVVFQGKKVKDDLGTLKQAGISQCSNLDSLGFTLERSFKHVSPSTTPKKFLIADQPLPMSPATPMIDSGLSDASVDPPLVAKIDDVDSKEFIFSPSTPVDVLLDGEATESKALVPVSPMNVDPLAVVPSNHKPKRAELSQRRTRRPFSVGEVEALVEAVETLGTGRWRDVKMRAFENADHRTYVDLKDKWKTLVHTASISPQQRRGEPVPQDLLDRVLSAHSYWSQHQSKLHGKHQIEPLKIGDSREEEIVGV
ncbi:hypothetical protein ABFS83_06G076500 [Erythranthe nasuta]